MKQKKMKDFMVTLFNVCRDIDKEFDITILSIVVNGRERCLFSYGTMGGQRYLDLFFFRVKGEIRNLNKR